MPVFLFTDIEKSTQKWENYAEAMSRALLQHDAILEENVGKYGGRIIKHTGDGIFAVFDEHTGDPLACALDIQRGFEAAHWDDPIHEVRIRMGLHSGPAERRGDDYFGPVINRTARLMGAAWGGQTLVTPEVLNTCKLPDGASLDDFGMHQLKDLPDPQRVYGLIHPDLRLREFPLIKSLSARPNNLPNQATEFVGRQDDIRAVQDLLDAPENHLITIVGPGGMGKTRLSLEVAAQNLETFTHGVYFIALDPLESGEDIVQALIEALNLSFSGGEDVETQVLRYLANKRLLLVMDNFESVLDGADLVSRILQSAPDCKVLATTREKLRLSSETVYNLAGMTLVSEWSSLDEAMNSSPVELFCQSASRIDSGFVLGEADLPHLIELMTLIDGMPLGIVLAAGWVDTLSLAEILSELKSNLDFLESGMRDLPDRQRSLRAVFNGSWYRLTESEQAVFSRISVFRGGFTREAADEIAGASARDLAGLVSKSLVRRNPTTGRYFVHQLLSQFAAEVLDQDAEAKSKTQEAHARYFADFTSAQWPELTIRGQEPNATLDAIEADIENIRAAWRYAVEQGNVSEVRKFIPTLWHFHDLRTWVDAGLKLFGSGYERFSKMSGDQELEALIAELQAGVAWNLMLAGKPQTAYEMSVESIETLIRLNEYQAFSAPFETVAMSILTMGDLERLADLDTYHTEAYLDSADDWTIAVGLMWEAAWPLLMNQQGSGVTIADAMHQANGSAWITQWLYVFEGIYSLRQSRFEDTIENFNKSVEIARRIGFQRSVGQSLTYLGRAHFAIGNYDEAQAHLLESLNLAHEYNLSRHTLDCLTYIARVWLAKGRSEDALSLLALVLTHPDRGQMAAGGQKMIDEEAEELRADVETRLPADAYDAAWQAGQNADLNTVVEELLAKQP